MKSRGYSAAAVLSDTGLREDQLADASCLVDAVQCQRVIGNMLRLSGNSALGLEIGRELESTDFGIVSHAMMSARTLRQAARTMQQFNDLVGGLVRVSVLDRDPAPGWTAVFHPVAPLEHVLHFCVEETLTLMRRLGENLGRFRFDIERIELAYPDPGYARLYRELFDCPVRFSREQTVVQVRRPALDSPLPGNDDEVNAIYRRHCQQVVRQIAGDEPIIPKLRAWLLHNMGEQPSRDKAAAALDMSVRTMSRKLQREGTSFLAVRQAMRHDLAREFLKQDRIPTKDIALQLGYQDTNAFRRAFTTWAGMSVNSCRQRRNGP